MNTILIVDNRPINRESLSLLLNEYNYEVIEAEDGIQALKLAQNIKPSLIITDITMPHLDGLGLINELQKDPRLLEIPVIFYSATYKAIESHQLTNAWNVKYVLTKPCEPEKILNAIKSVLSPNLQMKDRCSTQLNDDINHGKNEKFENINLRLTNIIEISLDMSQEHDMEKLTNIMCKASRQFLNACYAGVIVQSLEDPNVYKNVSISRSGALNACALEESNLPSPLIDIFLSEKMVCIHSPTVDVGKIGLNDISLPFSSLLCLPIKTSRAYYGKIYFINKFKQSFFTPSDQRFMMTLADKFAIHYENLMLYQKVERHSNQLEVEISQRKQTEVFLKEVTERLHLSLEAAHIGIWSWSIEHNQLNWDKYACRLFGINQNDFIGTLDAFLEHVLYEDKERVLQELLAIRDIGKNQPIEFRVVWPDNSIHHLMLRGKMDYGPLGEPVRMLGVYWDITEHVQTEEKLRLYREKISEAVRSNSLGEMASSLAHEINQPLAAIAAYTKGCIMRIENKNRITPEIIEILRETALQAERAGEVVHRIKRFVRKGELFYEKLDINTVIEETIRIMQQDIQRYSTQIIYNRNDNLPTIEADKIQLQQVILNLSRNAMQAMNEAAILYPQIIVETLNNESKNITVRIIDNGPGFSEQTAKYLFDLYFTTKSNGMGLGLAISRSIIEAHSGQLTGTVLPQGGSCFQFQLPIK